MEEEKKTIQEKVKDEESRKAKLVMIEGKLNKKQAVDKVRPEIIWNYKIIFPYDLVRLARNLWKHFDTYPSSINVNISISCNDYTFFYEEIW